MDETWDEVWQRAFIVLRHCPIIQVVIYFENNVLMLDRHCEHATFLMLA
ncbi:hypothetical protein RIE95_06235 [Acidithiobacillus thiooxidans]|nr:hypothetical protein [Acidithiobacillus thiooxidans]MDR7926591.1 hypothetical protein [Acidithiobacillus thiooxidans]